MSKSDGYILIARKLLKHPRFKPRGAFTQLEAWIWLLEAAAYMPREVPIMMGNRRDRVNRQSGNAPNGKCSDFHRRLLNFSLCSL